MNWTVLFLLWKPIQTTLFVILPVKLPRMNLKMKMTVTRKKNKVKINVILLNVIAFVSFMF